MLLVGGLRRLSKVILKVPCIQIYKGLVCVRFGKWIDESPSEVFEQMLPMKKKKDEADKQRAMIW